MNRSSFVHAGLTLVVASSLAVAQAPKAAHTDAKPQAARSQAAAKPKYKRDLPKALKQEAKIDEATAAAAAMGAVPGAKISSVELEKEDGKFIYSYDMKTPGKPGIDEVHVDAMTGAVVSNVHETPADEKAEKAKEKQEKKDAAKMKKPAETPAKKKP